MEAFRPETVGGLDESLTRPRWGTNDRPQGAGSKKTMNAYEYDKEIDSIAAWISDNRPAELGGKGWATEYREGYDAHAALWETLDGHRWVIYTHHARQVIAHSDNPNALMDEFGADAGGERFDERRAFYAMYTDIMEIADFEKYDLDELRAEISAERFEKLTQSDDFKTWVREIVAGVTVPRWSAETVTTTEWFETNDGEVEINLRWVPNNSHPRPVVRVSDEDWNEATIRY